MSLGHRALLCLPPETAHDIGVAAIARGWVRCASPPDRPVEAFGIRFRNPVGLAAGFDKNGVAVSQWHRLGFGFVEIGTVTRHAQPGNPRPRLFRLPRDLALINRMGFNNDGAEVVAARLEQHCSPIPVGVNIGKSKATSHEEAASDYLFSFRLLAPLAAYVVVNVSSPNTPGLRELQRSEALRAVLDPLRSERPETPLFVKVAPDLDAESLESVATVAVELGLTGIVATNTTVGRPGLSGTSLPEGGLSGKPLGTIADGVLAHLASLKTGLVLIGSGGVMDKASFHRKVDKGATLVQVYTGFVYGGAGFVPSLFA